MHGLSHHTKPENFYSQATHTVSTKRKYTLHDLRQSRVLKTEGASGKVGGATHPLLSWSKLDQASFENDGGFGTPLPFI